MPVHVRFYLTDRWTLDVEDFEAQSALDLRRRLDEGPFIQFEIDEKIVLLARDHIIRVDIEATP